MVTRGGLVLAVAALSLAACGGAGHEGHGAMTQDSATHDEAGHHDPMGHADTSSFGAPGDPGRADRTVRVKATDALEFEPASIEVDAGEIVTFVVTNQGKLPHEFVLGDAEYQRAHEDEMSSGAGHGDNGVSVDPGTTTEITWEFSTAGTFEFACHVQGHYPGGMKGTIEVT